jgi:hypothetical protein
MPVVSVVNISDQPALWRIEAAEALGIPQHDAVDNWIDDHCSRQRVCGTEPTGRRTQASISQHNDTQ